MTTSKTTPKLNGFELPRYVYCVYGETTKPFLTSSKEKVKYITLQLENLGIKTTVLRYSLEGVEK